MRRLIDFYLRCLIGIMKLSRFIPLKLLYFFSDISGIILYHVARKHRKRISDNLAKIFPDITNRELKCISISLFRNMYDFTFEIVKSTYFSDDEFLHRCQCTNKEEIEEILRMNSRIICYSGHFVNYEWLVSFPLHIPGVLMGNLYYSGKSNPLMEWLTNSRRRFGGKTIPHKYPIKPILSMFDEQEKCKYKGILLGTLADVPPHKKNEKSIHKSPFFDNYLSVYSGSERIGRRYNMLFMYAYIRRTSRGFYSIELKELKPNDVETNPYAYTDEFVRQLEQNIREQPDLWLLWSNQRLYISNE